MSAVQAWLDERPVRQVIRYRSPVFGIVTYTTHWYRTTDAVADLDATLAADKTALRGYVACKTPPFLYRRHRS